jgi:hypothetical protein
MVLKGGKRRKSCSQKGGMGASEWQLNNLGDGWKQFTNALTIQPGENSRTSQSNDIVPIKNLNAQNSRPAMSQKMTGGRKRRPKKGGDWGAVIGQAAVPLALLGMQQMYGKKRTRKARSFKRKSRRYRH